MGCQLCCCRKVTAGPDPVFVEGKDRKCTDVIFCLAFLAFWIGMIVIAAIAFSLGDPNRLVRGTDYQGNVCGSGNNGKYTYYPRITEDLVAFVSAGGTNPLKISLFAICLSVCPGAGDVVCTANGTQAIEIAMVQTATTTRADALAACKQPNAYVAVSALRTACSQTRQNCWFVPLNTSDYLTRCIWQQETVSAREDTCLSPPSLANKTKSELVQSGQWSQCVTVNSTTVASTTGAAQSNPVLDIMFQSAAQFGRFMSDIQKALPVIIVCGAGVSFILGFVWLIFVKTCTGVLVWITVWLALVAAIIVTIVSYFRAGILTKELVASAENSFSAAISVNVTVSLPSQATQASTNLKKQWSYFAYAMTAFTVILFVVVLWMRKSIQIAIGIIKEASSALQAMKSLLLYPLVTLLATTILMIYWIFVTAYMASAGNNVAESAAYLSASNFANSKNLTALLCAYNGTTQASNSTCDSLLASTTFTPANSKRFALVYHLFGLLWTNQFIQAFGIMVISGAVAQWYFTANKKDDLPRTPCVSACCRTARYHLGSIAFGSFLIALVQLIRIALAYIDQKTKAAQKKNKTLAIVMKCLQCLLWCFEKCLKFITKYAFIIVATKGKSFCSSAGQAIALIATNPGQIAVLEAITSLMFLVGKIGIAAVSGLFGYAWLDKAANYQPGGKDELSSQLIPLALLVLLAWVVGSAFLGVYQLAIETILVCFCEDKSCRKGDASEPYFMSDNLKSIIGANMTSAADADAKAKVESKPEGGPLVSSSAAIHVAPL